MNKKEIYCYNIDDLDRHILENSCSKMQIKVSLLDDGMLQRRVEDLLQDKDLISNQDSTHFDTSFMLMNNITDEELKTILAQGEQAKWDYHPIKMMVTEHNREWTLKELFAEVSREHQLFAKAEVLSGLIRQADKADRSSWDAERLQHCNEVLMSSYVLLKSGDFEEARLDQAIESLRACLQA